MAIAICVCIDWMKVVQNAQKGKTMYICCNISDTKFSEIVIPIKVSMCVLSYQFTNNFQLNFSNIFYEKFYRIYIQMFIFSASPLHLSSHSMPLNKILKVHYCAHSHRLYTHILYIPDSIGSDAPNAFSVLLLQTTHEDTSRRKRCSPPPICIALHNIQKNVQISKIGPPRSYFIYLYIFF